MLVRKEIVFDGIPCVYHVVQNDKPAMILVHGYCSDSLVWEQIIPILSTKYSLIIPDLIGYGESSLGLDFSMDYLASYLKSILTDEKIDKVIYVGHSMGGYIGLEFLKIYPQFLTGMTLLNSHCFTDSSEKATNREKTILFLKKFGSEVYVNEIFKTLFGNEFKLKCPQIVERVKQRAKRYPVETLIQSCQGMIDRKDHTSTLKFANIPIQFIWGEKDLLIPLIDFSSQLVLPMVSDINIIENMGHMGMYEQYEATASKIISLYN